MDMGMPLQVFSSINVFLGFLQLVLPFFPSMFICHLAFLSFLACN
uniref:Uncharacterized protein n=1 Tax=Anguilla anguilla TaxID=7936 RepID=A0A0E9RVF2_ANGAN